MLLRHRPMSKHSDGERSSVRSLLKELGYIAPRWCEAVNEELERELVELDRALGESETEWNDEGR